MQKEKNRSLKYTSYIVFAGLILLIYSSGWFSFPAGRLTVTYIGLTLFILAFISSLLSFIKYITRRKEKYIYVGIGFLGASLLDLYHLFFVPLAYFWRGILNNPSDLYLSILLFFSWAVWFVNKKEDKKVKNTRVFITPILFSGSFLLFLSVFPSLGLYLTALSTIIYLAVFIAYIKKSYWTFKYFEYFFIFSLISLFFSQALLLVNWQGEITYILTFSLMLKMFGYFSSLVGLLASSYNAFDLVETYSKKIEARLKASVEDLPLGYILLDENNKILVKNDILQEMLGEKAQDDTWLNKLLGLSSMSRDVANNEKVLVNEIEENDKYLKLFYTSVAIGTTPLGMVVLVQDITREKLLDKTKDEFIALASHELRTPITLVKGNSDMLLSFLEDKRMDRSTLRTMIEDVNTSAIRLLEITEQFLDVSVLEQEKTVFKKEDFDVVEVINKVVSSFKSDALRKNIKLDFKNDIGESGMIKGDRKKLYQVLNNLIDNAVKFTKEGKVVIHAFKDGSKLNVEVRDTGVGINEKSQKMLFKKFQQVGEDFLKHDSTQGVGLGLYISKMIVNKMNGELYLKSSEVNEGSVFVLELPLK